VPPSDADDVGRRGFSAAQLAGLPYVEKYRRVLMSSPLVSQGCRFTLVALARYANPHTGKGARPSRQTLADDTVVASVTTIQEHLKEGLAAGFILKARDGRPVQYDLDIPKAEMKRYRDMRPEEFDTSQARSDQSTGRYETAEISDQPTGRYGEPETVAATPLRPIEAVENPVSDQPTGREENIKDNPISSGTSKSALARPSVEDFMDEIARQRSESRATRGAIGNVFAYRQKVRANLEDERESIAAFMARRPGANAREYELERTTGLADDGCGNKVQTYRLVQEPDEIARSHIRGLRLSGWDDEADAAQAEYDRLYNDPLGAASEPRPYGRSQP
jgi:hypothetical protein